VNHSIKIPDEDYERLRERYGESWSYYARRYVTRALDTLDEVDRSNEVAVHVPSSVPSFASIVPLQLLVHGPRLHGRHGYYVMFLCDNDTIERQVIVYAETDDRSVACKRAQSLLDAGLIKHATYGDFINPRVVIGSHNTSRGHDIELYRKPEGLA
jgi:hypothetical protein